MRIDVLHTPGHTADSVSLVLPEDGPVDGPASGSALTGDTILGRGTTIIAQPDGSLAAYLASLEVLRDVGSGVIGLPAHGPVVPDLATTAPAPREDSDHDGMPDAWERANGLDPGNGNDGAAFAVNGYTHVENYLNALAGDPIP